MAPIFFFSEQIKDAYIKFYKDRYGIIVSEQFLKCADLHLRNDFESKTGIKINKHTSIANPLTDSVFYVKDKISKLSHSLYINHNWNPIDILWSSTTGRIYDTADTDIDCNDVMFWFEGLDPVLYHKQLYPKTELPFKLKDLSYELVVTRLNMDCTIEMLLKPENTQAPDNIIKDIDTFLSDFNLKSEKKDRKDGVVHNWKRSIEGDKLIYELDAGSAGVVFLKKLLLFLSTLNLFSKVEIK